MKLAIAGATGFCGAETVRQALQDPAITSVLALSRRPVTAPEGVDSSKLQTVIVDDFLHYSDDALKEFSNLDACIWTIAITPTKSVNFAWDEVQKVCLDMPMAALKAMTTHRTVDTPLRFVFYIGWGAQRDQTKTPEFLPQYTLMRGQVENKALQFAAESGGRVEVLCAKPGYIVGPGRPIPDAVKVSGVPSISVYECVAATLKQCTQGIDKDPLMNDELAIVGREYLKGKEEIKLST